MSEDILMAAEAPPAPPAPPPPVAPVAPEKGSPEWLILQIEEMQHKMDRIINRFM